MQHKAGHGGVVTAVALGLLLGALLGLRYTVVVLVPWHAAAVTVGIIGLLAGASIGAMVSAFLSWSAACQAAYAITALVVGRPRASEGLARPHARRVS